LFFAVIERTYAEIVAVMTRPPDQTATVLDLECRLTGLYRAQEGLGRR
jgi:hypothetical protein